MANLKRASRRSWQAKPKPQQGRKASNKFYHTTEWRKLRNEFITDNPLCVICNKPGKVVDHIKPIEKGGAPLDKDNLQTMCHSCHNKKSGKERHA